MSFPRYSQYKESGVEWLGEIPSHWTIEKVRWLFQIRKRIAGDVGFDVLSITQNGIRVKDVESNDGQLSMDYSKYQLVEIGDFAMNHMDLLTGFVDIAPLSGVTSPDYRVFSLSDPSRHFDRYFLRLFQNAYTKRIFFPYGQGSSHLGRWRLSAEEFNSFVLPTPPKREQVEIASFIDRETAKIDALVAEQEKLIALLKEKRQAVISHAVTKGLGSDAPMTDLGVEWLGRVPKHWSVSALKRACSFIKDGTHLPPSRVADGVPLLSVRNLIDGRFELRNDDSMISKESYRDLCRSFVPEANDVLLAIVGATIGKAAIVPNGFGKFHIQRSLAIFRTGKTILPKWLLLIFESSQFQRALWENVGYSAQPGIYLGTLAEFRIPVPPIVEQDDICKDLSNRVAETDYLLSESARAIKLLKERRSALISAAVTGKIDVRGLAAAAA